MADKVLRSVPLSEVRTHDEETLGSVCTIRGVKYRWVKNSCSTTIGHKCPAVNKVVATAANWGQKVVAPSGSTDSVTSRAVLLAGVAVTSIPASGSSTGCYGWIAVRGIVTAAVGRMATAITAGAVAIVSNTCDVGLYPSVATSPSGLISNKAIVLQGIASTGAGVGVETLVDLKCD